jgi:hypothetical protein
MTPLLLLGIVGVLILAAGLVVGAVVLLRPDPPPPLPDPPPPSPVWQAGEALDDLPPGVARRGPARHSRRV